MHTWLSRYQRWCIWRCDVDLVQCEVLRKFDGPVGRRTECYSTNYLRSRSGAGGRRIMSVTQVIIIICNDRSPCYPLCIQWRPLVPPWWRKTRNRPARTLAVSGNGFKVKMCSKNLQLANPDGNLSRRTSYKINEWNWGQNLTYINA